MSNDRERPFVFAESGSRGQAQLVDVDRVRQHARSLRTEAKAFARPGMADLEIEHLTEHSDMTRRPVRRAGPWGTTLRSAWERVRSTLRRKPTGECDLVREAYSAMNACIGCRSCGVDCPLKGELSELKSCFVEVYHRQRSQGAADGLVAGFELLVPWLAAAPRPARALLHSPWVEATLKGSLGVVNFPRLSTMSLRAELSARGKRFLPPWRLLELSPRERRRGVVLVQDVFTTYFEPRLVLATCDLIEALGYDVYVLELIPTGRGLRVKGFEHESARVAARCAERLDRAMCAGMPLVGIDPAVTLGHRAGTAADPSPRRPVLLLQEWADLEEKSIARFVPSHPVVGPRPERYWLLPHCSERGILRDGVEMWQRTFSRFGVDLCVWASGCHRGAETGECRLAGVEMDRNGSTPVRDRIVATGHPCREELSGDELGRVRHPIEVLARLARNARGCTDGGKRLP